MRDAVSPVAKYLRTPADLTIAQSDMLQTALAGRGPNAFRSIRNGASSSRCRRRGGGVAARGAGAAVGKLPTIGFLGLGHVLDLEPVDRRFRAAAA